MHASQASCPFCCQDAIEPQLVFETADFLLAADLHPLVEGHLLLIPRQPLSCYGALPEEQIPRFLQLRARVAAFLAACYGPPTFFEHGMAGQTVPHAHLHAIPSLPSLLPTIGVGRHVTPASGPEAVRAWFRARGPYLFYQEEDRAYLIEPGEIPAGYLEGVAASLLAEQAPKPDGRALAERVRQRWQQHRTAVADAVIDLVACFLRRDGRICLLHRSPAMQSAPGRWHILTGYLPEGVDPLQHALHEIEEETGLAPPQLHLARSGEPLLLQRRGDVRRWRVHPFLFDVLYGEPQLNWEHVDYRWVPPSDLAHFDLLGWVPRALSDLIEAS